MIDTFIWLPATQKQQASLMEACLFMDALLAEL